jgi:hypothetical protein
MRRPPQIKAPRITEEFDKGNSLAHFSLFMKHSRFVMKAHLSREFVSKLAALTVIPLLLTVGCGQPKEVKPPEATANATVTPPPDIAPPGLVPEVAFLRKPGIDLVGPAQDPDGEPDFVIQVRLDPSLLKKVAVWEINANEGRGNWISISNPTGVWLIKAVVDNATPAAGHGQVQVKLCFKDNGDPQISSFTLRASDQAGATLFQETVR